MACRIVTVPKALEKEAHEEHQPGLEFSFCFAILSQNSIYPAMTFFIFGKWHVNPLWRFQASGTIWRILFSPNDFIIGEERDQDRKIVRLFAINAADGKVLWVERELPEPWWTEIEACTESTIFVSEYAQPDLPIHAGITALDLQTGEVLWRNPGVTFYFELTGALIVKKEEITGTRFLKLGAQTGEVLEDYGARVDEVLALRALNQQENDVQLPFPYRGDAEGLEELRSLIQSILPKQGQRGDVELLPADPYVVLSFHVVDSKTEDGEERLAQRLMVINRDSSKVVFAHTLLNDARYPAMQSFAVRKGILYFIENRDTLVAVNLQIGKL